MKNQLDQQISSEFEQLFLSRIKKWEDKYNSEHAKRSFEEQAEFFKSYDNSMKSYGGKVFERICEKVLSQEGVPFTRQRLFQNRLKIDLACPMDSWYAEVQTTIRERVDGKMKKYDEFIPKGSKKFLICLKEEPNKKQVERAVKLGWTFVKIGSSSTGNGVISFSQFLEEVSK